MGIFGDMINYIIDMGASAMLPLVIAILSIIVGVKIGKAVRAGLMVGVGFVGLGLIVDMMNANLGPAAQQMSKNFGLSMSVVDLGWPGMSPITWASSIATVAIPVAILVNIIMLVLKLTKTVNIDIWNIWHMTFTGAIAYAVTGNFAIGIGGVVVHAIIAYKFGDLYAPLMEDYFELDGITVPHGTGTWMAPFAFAIDAIIEKIPGLNKIDFSIDNLQEKVGVLAEPIVIGGILSGVFTPTEAAGVAVVYAFILAVFVYKNIKLSQMKDVLVSTATMTTIVMLIIGASSVLSFVLSFTGLPQAISNLMLGLTTNKVILLLLINIILLVVGTFMDMAPALLIFTPIFLPVAQSVGMDAIQFGVMIVMNLSIGTITPPVGSVLFVGCSVAELKVEDVIRRLLPYFAAICVSLLFVTFVPAVSTWLPTVLGLM